MAHYGAFKVVSLLECDLAFAARHLDGAEAKTRCSASVNAQHEDECWKLSTSAALRVTSSICMKLASVTAAAAETRTRRGSSSREGSKLGAFAIS